MEFASALTYCDHAVGDQAVIEDGVTFMEDIYMISNLYFERTLNDYIKFLTVVRVELHGSILFFREIGKFNEERFCEFFLEFRREVVVFHAVLFQNLQTFAFSGDGEGCKRGASAFEQVSNLNIARFCALVDKCEAEVGLTGFQNFIFFNGNTGELRKLFFGVSFRFPQVLDSSCNLFQTVIHCCVSFR